MKKFVNKKNVIIGVICLIVGLSFGRLAYNEECLVFKKNFVIIPQPVVNEEERIEFGIDLNINEATIDQYLNRSDSVYRDMRMLKDPANYEAIGGESYLTGFIDGFEVVPYPYLVRVGGLPDEVGESYTGNTLFTKNEDDSYTPNYEESLHILEDLFPKDKIIFLMCNEGGYAGMTRDLLISFGWDKNRIYNIGGYWNYNGKNNIPVARETKDGTKYEFYKVPYHNIDFDTLTKINND